MSGAIPPLPIDCHGVHSDKFAFIMVIAFYMESWIQLTCMVPGVRLLC